MAEDTKSPNEKDNDALPSITPEESDPDALIEDTKITNNDLPFAAPAWVVVGPPDYAPLDYAPLKTPPKK